MMDSYKFKESNTVSERRVQRAPGGFDCVHVNFITDDKGEGKRGMKDAGARYADVGFLRGAYSDSFLPRNVDNLYRISNIFPGTSLLVRVRFLISGLSRCAL